MKRICKQALYSKLLQYVQWNWLIDAYMKEKRKEIEEYRNIVRPLLTK